MRRSCGGDRAAAGRAAVVVLAVAHATLLSAQNAKPGSYRPAAQVSGTVRVCGSPQMGDLLRLYEQGFVRVQPGVRFENHLESTVTAISGVASGKAQIGLLGREMWPDEEREFVAMRGHAPLVVEIATGSYDVPKATFALMIYVPKKNPIASVTLTQLEHVFSTRDGKSSIQTWGQLGLKGAWAAQPVHLYGFATDNDKAKIFRKLVFRKGEEWSADLTTFGNKGGVDAGELILRAVAGDPDAIGISNVHYETAAVRALPIAPSARRAPVAPTRNNVASRRYPLTRAVYMLANTTAGHPLGPAVYEFLRYVLSENGRRDVVEEGNYLPLPGVVARNELDKLSSANR